MCCLSDMIPGGAPPNPASCMEYTQVPATTGGESNINGVSASQRLLRCINGANTTLSNTGTMADEVASISAAGVWWNPKAASVPITLITQLSIGRLPQLWAQCRSWRGPLSAAVFAPMLDGAAKMPKRQLWCAMQQAYALYMRARDDPTVCDLDIVLLFEQRHDRSAMIYYPVNVLRNMARLQARTEMVAMVDVDMLMSSELVTWVQTPANVQSMLRACRAKSVFVLPAFEVVLDASTAVQAALADSFVATSKTHLLEGMRERTVLPFAAERYPPGHGATNFSLWAKTDAMYEVPYADGFEPWVMTHRLLAPWHDARFRGYGLNKISHIAHLNASGFKFIVHPSAFIIHRAHNVSVARKLFMKDKSQHFYLRWKNVTMPAVQSQSNSYLKVKALFADMKELMNRGTFTPMTDYATDNCLSRNLLWWWRRKTGGGTEKTVVEPQLWWENTEPTKAWKRLSA